MRYFIFLFLILVSWSSCIKKECRIAGAYEFEVPATLSPAKDTFSIGDTITIVSSFLDEVYERKTDRFYKLENFRFFPGTEIKKVDVSPALDGLPFFDIVIDHSTNYGLRTYSGGETRLKGEYNYLLNEYYLRFQIVTQEVGLFYIEQSIALSLNENQEFEGKCSNIGIDGAINLNNGADNNIEMLHNSPDEHYNDWILQKPEQRFHKFGGYCFYVKE